MKSASSRYRYYHNCVAWPRPAGERGGLMDMIDEARRISRRTFLRHVDREEQQEIERQLGYVTHSWERGLTMARDWHVTYHRSRLYGRRVYYFQHSGIEYVFCQEGLT